MKYIYYIHIIHYTYYTYYTKLYNFAFFIVLKERIFIFYNIIQF